MPHIALLPSAGMGHLAPFTRLAAALSSHGCRVTIIAAQPTVSTAESLHLSHLLSSFPSISLFPLPLIDLDPHEFPPNSDPFFLRFEAIRRSSHLLSPLLSSSFSALVIDVSLFSAFVPVAKSLSLPCYALFTSSAAMLAFCAYFPTYLKQNKKNTSDSIGDVHVPGLWTVPRSSVAPALQDPSNLFYQQFVENGVSFPMADGILVNTFEALEGETLQELNKGSVVRDLCPVLAIGPLRPVVRRMEIGEGGVATWLDRQPERSVVYVSFGSRTAMTAEQIRELGDGLEKSQCRFLWVIKTKKVDREEEADTQLEELLGEGYTERVKDRAMIINGWVEQEEILPHKSIAMFLTHCGWNSVTEAVFLGVKVMAWPRGGDQRINGEVVRRSGVGVWMEEWSWEAEDGVVSGDEIGRRVREVMECNEGLRSDGFREESLKALEVGGSSYKMLDEFIAKV